MKFNDHRKPSKQLSYELMPTKHNLVEHAPFGKLTVIERGPDRVDPKTGRHRPQWYCRCNCPAQTIKLIAQNVLISGHTVSCGCKQKEQRQEWMAKGLVFHKKFQPLREAQKKQ